MVNKRLVLLAASLGWLVSFILLIRFNHLATGRPIRYLPDFLVGLDLGSQCDALLLSPGSKFFNVPLGGLGIIYFILLLVLVAFGGKLFHNIATLIAAIGAGASIALLACFSFEVIPSCFYCYLVHFFNFGLFYLLWTKGEYSRKRNMLLVSIIIVSFIANFILLLSGPLGKQVVDYKELIAEYDTNPSFDIPLNGSPALGNSEAEIKMVVFSSFQCPGCQQFTKTIELIKRAYPDQVEIIFKHYPLSNKCNVNISSNMQPNSCAGAYAAEAAHQQENFWIYHDLLFESNLTCEEGELMDVAKKAELSYEGWESLRSDSLVLQRIQDDTALGASLSVTGTPGVFINGKKINDIGFISLMNIISHELEK